MTVLKRRSRQVSFRLSEDEYQILRQSCVTMGAHSISDVARSAVCDMIGLRRHVEGGPLELELRIRQLDRKVDQLVDLLENDHTRPTAKRTYHS